MNDPEKSEELTEIEADLRRAKGGGFGKGKDGKSGPVQVSVPPGLFDSKLGWEWHITESFKGLVTLSIEALKALLLINGGAAVAVLAYLGNLTSRTSVAHLPNLKVALWCFAIGVLIAAVTFLVAYHTQLRLYNEERARHTGERFRTLHSIGITLGTIFFLASAVAFGVGCWYAASAF